MARTKKGQAINGWVILDKPKGMTSTTAVAAVKRRLDAQKAGHAGTLDPLATGILPIALGEATKTVPFVVDGTKVYRFSIRWGAETDTDDSEGKVTVTSGKRPSRAEIEAFLPDFVGEIEQIPPQYSAIKISGERAYDLARDGIEFEIAPRKVTIYKLHIVETPDAETTTLEAECGKGTYVRAIARDLGRKLGCHGHIVALRRTRVGPFLEASAISLDQLDDFGHSAPAQEGAVGPIRPIEAALDDIPAFTVNRSDASRLRRGQPVLIRGANAPILTGPVYAMSSGLLVAVGEIERGELHPVRVFNL